MQMRIIIICVGGSMPNSCKNRPSRYTEKRFRCYLELPLIFSKCKLLSLTLMLLIFIGQSFAPVAMACQMESHDSSMMMSMADMDHSMHDMSSMKMDMSDCCDTDCTCPAGSCSQVTLPTSNAFLNIPVALLGISLPLQSAAQFTPTSLYRPPAAV